MSRELDAEVAEKVMGWTRKGDGWTHPDGTFWLATSPYSTDIAAAWLAVEKLRCERITIMRDGDEWNVRIWPDWRKAVYVTAPTAPEAICRAALKAVG